MKLGCHVSVGKGLYQAVKDAITVKADTIQFFSRNPRGGRAKNLDTQDLANARDLANANGISPLVAHAPYVINLCSDKKNLRRFAIETVTEDLGRMEAFGCSYFVIHPGSHVNQGRDWGKQLVAEALNEILGSYEGKTMLLLETMAGQGTEIGANFSELAEILEKVHTPDKVGICIDTCHLFAGGFSIDLTGEFLDTVESFLPLSKIKVCHLNDSKMPAASGKDRHAPLGQGEIGLENLVNFIAHPRLNHLPFILETPGELEHYGQELEELRVALGLSNN